MTMALVMAVRLLLQPALNDSRLTHLESGTLSSNTTGAY